MKGQLLPLYVVAATPRYLKGDCRAGVCESKKMALFHIKRKIRYRLYTTITFGKHTPAMFVFVDSTQACYLLT